MLEPDAAVVDIRRAAVDLLARREYSRHELREKLIRKFCRQSPAGDFRNASSRIRSRSCQDAVAIEAQELPAESVLSGGPESELQWESLIDQQLELLTQENLQSDERFVESFVRGAKNKGHGPHRIRQALQSKRVADVIAEHYLQENDDEWLELARAVYQKKFGTGRPDSYRDKARRQRFMQYRGFPHWIISHILYDDADVEC